MKSKFKQLKYKDLENRQSLENWVKESLSPLYANRDLPSSHLSIIIKKLEEDIKSANNINIEKNGIHTSNWLIRIEKIKKTITAVEEYNESTEEQL